MTKPVQLYCWHFMSYPYLPADFDERYETGWVNSAKLFGAHFPEMERSAEMAQ